MSVQTLHGLLVVTHYGVVTLGSSARYEEHCFEDNLFVAVDAIDGALTCFPSEPRVPESVICLPRAIIVRPDQYSQSVKFCAALAVRGVLRTVWLREHLPLALGWVQRASGARSEVAERPDMRPAFALAQ